jgi:hypothetical protein
MIPCKDCLVFAICKTKYIEICSADMIPMSPINIIANRCKLLSDYLNKDSKATRPLKVELLLSHFNEGSIRKKGV